MGLTSIWHWLVVLAIVIAVFGTKKLRNIGRDLGGAVHDFKEGLEKGTQTSESNDIKKDNVIEHQSDKSQDKSTS